MDYVYEAKFTGFGEEGRAGVEKEIIDGLLGKNNSKSCNQTYQ